MADFALVRRVSELESEIVTLEDQIAALTKELREVSNPVQYEQTMQLNCLSAKKEV